MDLFHVLVELCWPIKYLMAELALVFDGLDLLVIIVAVSELADLLQPLGVLWQCLRML